MNRTLPVSRRVRAITASATKLMAQEAARIGGCVSLGQGVPSFPTPPAVVAAVNRILCEDPASGKYTLQTGMPALRQRIARLLAEELLRLVLDLGGTISGEHGIGLAKRPFLPLELAPGSIDLQRRIKALFDPNQILNPGKIFP